MSDIEFSHKSATDFIRKIIREDLASGKHQQIVTRFPPEPNGHLHIGHAKSIHLNFGVANEFDGYCFMRFDDTNPVKEDEQYVEGILNDVRWLGYDWGERLTHASDYFERLYEFAEEMIQKGKAYVESLNAEEIRELRGTLTEPGKDSPYRVRSVEENMTLFRKMRGGEFEDGSHVLRAKIDMSSPNINLRDPVLYRIRKVSHQRTANQWCVYPLYDFTHGLSDALEGVTHSLCTLEFEDHRPLYNWILEEVSAPCLPRQIEFSRLNLRYSVLSKRRLIQLVEEEHVEGWDDPRMLTLSGLRRRGYPAAAIRLFCERIGISKSENNIEMNVLEDCAREELDKTAPRVMAVLRPLKVVITDYPKNETEEFEPARHPKNPEMGTRTLPFSREIYIDRDDFREDPPPKYFRLAPGKEVRLRFAYVIRCNEVIYENGKIIELRCTYDKATRSGVKAEGRKVKGIIHWVSIQHSVSAEVRLYDRLFAAPYPGRDDPERDFLKDLNPESVEIISKCKVEPALLEAKPEDVFQFERVGYFCVDSKKSRPEALVFNRTVTLRDTWAKLEQEKNPQN
ncbi:MAG TPA: glutamine--tRNA ligase/YqeY domain fusion protein [Candidatus Lambdaproteobacteria bacterium]|nr:glutamine--tRNA ligase/YqeY domain fusion protein [Candidatus Lambdaproteobacteria bacterium]HIN47791.1 glutamine--tRNA ligase/YqeY domain fusion protein [Deltaproteobacteria bacterium]HIA56996.1 glutamine--tRNA ligase/YqeY domain fusion protein [Candidatus Lambdaproteobacteria bacterium]HIB45197.1 glutamine--tRNA ligase/YqeY domain fusion protein [Candidatus Lambdaproteobacteria bacterium]HIB93514.1 glutamine--tRNA ligase/YqeY domain fusion protein [Candidatus Lambdaproteobacteria bacterium